MIRFLLVFILLGCGLMLRSQQLDESFGNRGDGFLVLNDDAIPHKVPMDITISSDGFYVLTKSCEDRDLFPCNSMFQLYKFNGNGIKFQDFALEGRLLQKVSQRVSSGGIELLGDSVVSVVIESNKLGSPEKIGYLFHYSPEGNVDSTFGKDGMLDLTQNDTVARLSYFYDSQGRIYVLGEANWMDPNRRYRTLERFTNKGILDTAFGDSGFMSLPNTVDSVSSVQQVHLDQSGDWFYTFSPYLEVATGERIRLFVEKLDLTAHYDSTFGKNGVWTSGLLYDSFVEERLHIFQVTQHQDIITVNSSGGRTGAVTRLTTSGISVSSFAEEGILFNPTDTRQKVYLAESGYLYFFYGAGPKFMLTEYTDKGINSGTFGNNGTFDFSLPEPVEFSFLLYGASQSPTAALLSGVSQINEDSTVCIVVKVDELTTALEDVEVQYETRIFPNPTQNTLHLPQELSTQNLTLYNSQGQQFEVVQPSAGKLDVSHLASGMYVLQAGERVWRFVKE